MEPAAWAVPDRPGGPITSWRHTGCRQARRARAAARPAPGSPSPPRQVEIVVAVHNQAATLEHDIVSLRHALDESFPFRAVVTVADTGSTDGTAPIAQRLAATVPGIQALLLTSQDRGHALRMALASSRTEIVACVDAVSSSSLPHLLSLVDSVLAGRGDLAVAAPAQGSGARGFRGADGLSARVRRHLRRLWPGGDGSNADCGLTAVRRSRALEILPLIEDHKRSFTTGLVRAADRRGLRITQIPESR